MQCRGSAGAGSGTRVSGQRCWGKIPLERGLRIGYSADCKCDFNKFLGAGRHLHSPDRVKMSNKVLSLAIWCAAAGAAGAWVGETYRPMANVMNTATIPHVASCAKRAGSPNVAEEAALVACAARHSVPVELDSLQAQAAISGGESSIGLNAKMCHNEPFHVLTSAIFVLEIYDEDGAKTSLEKTGHAWVPYGEERKVEILFDDAPSAQDIRWCEEDEEPADCAIWGFRNLMGVAVN